MSRLIDDLRESMRTCGQPECDVCAQSRETISQLEAMQAEIERLRTALRDLLAAVDAADSVKRGDFYHERKAARASLTQPYLGNEGE